MTAPRTTGFAEEPPFPRRLTDRTIAAQAGPDRLYRPNRHLAEARRDVRLGGDPDTFVAAHVRRLEALRRAGIVERMDDGAWPLPADYLDRAASFEAERLGGAAVELRSHLDLRGQARAIGATWLDRALIEGASPSPAGFGAEVRDALEERRVFLVGEGLAA